QSEAKEIAMQYVNTFDGVKSLLFSGNCGLGKSHLSFAITKALRQQGYKTLYIKVTDLFDYIKNTYKPDSSINEMQIFKMIDELDLLVLVILALSTLKQMNMVMRVGHLMCYIKYLICD